MNINNCNKLKYKIARKYTTIVIDHHTVNEELDIFCLNTFLLQVHQPEPQK